ncbi:MAG TPA: hypothetical protein VHK47_11185 [Polyangia bacterium]|nr:hypothetical protein [Polyangia bacterium]
MTIAPCPDFAEALRWLREVLRTRGWPEEVRWVRPGDVEWTPPPADVVVFLNGDDDGAAEAERAFEDQRRAGRGAVLRAVCTWGEVTCATLEASDAPGGPLELSVVEPRRLASARWAFC